MYQTKDLSGMILKMSGAHSPYEVFHDWVKMMALAFANSSTVIPDKVWKAREKEYLNTINSYGDEGYRFPEMYAMLVDIAENNMSDHLGEIYMRLGCGNENVGQFFTPYHLSLLNARMAIEGETIQENVKLVEPSCGGGGMIIAAAQVLKEKGINYQKRLKVVAQDLDWNSVYMCYVQLCLYGINGTVVQGDSLAETYVPGYPRERVFRTPGNMGVLL